MTVDLHAIRAARQPHTPRIRVAALDNDAMSLQMTQMLLTRQPIFDVIWTTQQPAVAIQSCISAIDRPDVLVVDMALNGITGLDVCSKIRRISDDIQFVGVTAYDPMAYLPKALEIGLTDIVRKDCFADIPRTVLKVMNGRYTTANENTGTASDSQMRPAVIGNDGADSNSGSETAPIISAPLSARELELLHHYAQGKSTAEIIDLMQVSKSTLWSYESRALKKLQARNRVEAVATCVRMHVLD